ncbi:hypothetical protein EXIGLDRAFT_327668 [Exidia glandulosa HHB12029]|uniref:Uncharacterized protein n=1 Tax=Exidia glandulosa HHB12029 TaxID=1314781 RepID=A0A165LP39_EXIGL|nr:hypothetical protein EXIGLDRAFT_327668 [Exidia glandulosa HHB12029]
MTRPWRARECRRQEAEIAATRPGSSVYSCPHSIHSQRPKLHKSCLSIQSRGIAICGRNRYTETSLAKYSGWVALGVFNLLILSIDSFQSVTIRATPSISHRVS